MAAETVYRADNNQPFSSGDEFLQAGGDWNTIQTRKVDVKLNPSTTTNTNTLTADTITNNDIQSLIAQNQKFQESVLGYMTPTSAEVTQAEKVNKFQTDAESTQLRAQAGIQQEGNRFAPMTAIQGGQRNIAEQANLQLQTLGIQQNAAARTLQGLQSQRQSLLQAATAQVGFGQQNLAIQMQLDSMRKKEQAEALKFALDMQISKPYFLVGQTVYDTNSGQPFTSEVDFLQKTGMDVGQAEARGMIQRDIQTPDQRARAFQQEQFEWNKYMDIQNLDLAMYKATNSTTGVLTPEDKMKFERTLANDFEKYAKESNQAITSLNLIETSYQEAVKAGHNGESLNAASQGVLVKFQKMLDPTSVVRESEYARSGAGQSLWQRIEGTYQKLQQGGAGVTMKELESFYQLSQQLMKDYQASNLDYAQRSAYVANKYELDLNAILTPRTLDLLNKSGWVPPQIETNLESEWENFFGGTTDNPNFVGPVSPGFNSAGKPQASTSVDKVMAAIGQYESGGNYKAIGPKTRTGDQAYGKYQVMGANIPSWTKAALGYSMTPQQFLNNPKAQDAVAKYQMSKHIAAGYGVEDVASIWFSGQPMAKAGNKKDIIGTSVPKYIANIKAIYNRLT